MRKRNNGSALIMTILLMAVLSVLGAAILRVSLTETRHIANDDRRTKAYYIAKSGVEATAAWMKKNPDDVDDIINVTSAEREFGTGSFKVRVEEDNANPDRLIVTGIAEVGGTTNTASLEMYRTEVDAPLDIFEYALYSHSEINMKGSSYIKGKVRSAKDIYESVNGNSNKGIDGDKAPNNPMETPMPLFPADPSESEDLNVSSNRTLGDSEGTMLVYRKLSLTGGQATLTFNTLNDTSDESKGSHNLIVVVDELDFQTGANGGIEVKGEGSVIIYAKTVAKFNTTVNENGDPRQMFIILGEDAQIHFASNDTMKMFVYGPQAGVSCTGTPNIYGGMILEDTNPMSGNFDITYIEGYNNGLPVDIISGVHYSSGYWLN